MNAPVTHIIRVSYQDDMYSTPSLGLGCYRLPIRLADLDLPWCSTSLLRFQHAGLGQFRRMQK